MPPVLKQERCRIFDDGGGGENGPYRIKVLERDKIGESRKDGQSLKCG